jgi:hypothetical protein
MEATHHIPHRKLVDRALQQIPTARPMLGTYQAAFFKLPHDGFGARQAKPNLPGQTDRRYGLVDRRRRDDAHCVQALRNMEAEKHRVCVGFDASNLSLKRIFY